MNHAILSRNTYRSLQDLRSFLKFKKHQDKLTSFLKFNMTKNDITNCPLKAYDGRIHIITSEDDEYIPENEKAIQSIMNSPVVGFDTESAVFVNKRGNGLPLALIQLANEDTVILWRLRRDKKYLWNNSGILRSILKNKDIRKVGSGIEMDVRGLRCQYDVSMSNAVDNQVIAKDLGLVRIGLMSLTAQLFGWRISKDKQLSNWEAHKLDSRQLLYAATDAWASFLVYKELLSITEALEMNYPEPLPSMFETALHVESMLDSKMFSSIDQQLYGDVLPKRTMRYFITQRYYRLQKRKTQKMNYSVDDVNLDCVLASCKKSVLESSFHKNIKDGKTIQHKFVNNLPGYGHTLCSSSQLPFLYRAVPR